MECLTMDYQLTLTAVLRRVEALYGHTEVVTRLPDRSLRRTTYGEFVARAKRLAVALGELGIRRGDRVATLCWNHYQHLECYFGIPAAGAVLHTLNLRLHADELAYIANHAGDRAVVVDESLVPLLEQFRGRCPFEHVLVVSAGGPLPEGALDYEATLAAAEPAAYEELDLREDEPGAMCYTTGTTGNPKGVLYSHRALVLHSVVSALPGSMTLSEADVVLPVVPMFHANAWGMPITAALMGSKQVFPGPFLDAGSLLELLESERVTITGGVPTIWLGILHSLDEQPGRYDLSALRTMIVGGSAAPRALIEGFQERHGLTVCHAWGMTEMTPLGTVARLPPELEEAPKEARYAFRAKQGRPGAFVEIRARGAEGLVPWDGETMGELEVRGPAVARAYYESPGSEDRWTEDGWFRTGDIVTIDGRGTIEIQDRAKDLIKSGGEWISSVALENALMGHPAVAEAAVVGVADARWGERPLAAVVLKEGRSATAEELRDYLTPQFAKWWLPETFEFVAEIPRTSAGKFKKAALRERFGAGQPVSG